MIKLLSIISIILAIVLFPPATLAVISNNAVPGDSTYPIKRSLEDVIFAVASINPTTKAWFAAARSDRRFKELTVLITQGKGATETLNELVEQTQVAASQIAQVTDEEEKAKLIEQLQVSIEKYDQGLQQFADSSKTSTTPGQTVSNSFSEDNSIQSDSISQRSASPQVPNTPSPSSTQLANQPTNPPSVQSSPKVTSRPTPRPTITPKIPNTTPDVESTLKPFPISHSSPRPTQAPNRDEEKEKQKQKEIEEARKKLEEVKRELQEGALKKNSQNIEEPKKRSSDEDKKEDKTNNHQDRTKGRKGDSSKEE